jgi:hypothetical protein
MHRRDDYPERSGVGAKGVCGSGSAWRYHARRRGAERRLSVGYGFAPMIAARIKPETAHGVQRVIAFVLLSIRVQIT